jgi:hypothetical protein
MFVIGRSLPRILAAGKVRSLTYSEALKKGSICVGYKALDMAGKATRDKLLRLFGNFISDKEAK